MPLFYVKIRKNIDICNYLPIYYPAICRGWGTFSVPSRNSVERNNPAQWINHIEQGYTLLYINDCIGKQT